MTLQEQCGQPHAREGGAAVEQTARWAGAWGRRYGKCALVRGQACTESLVTRSRDFINGYKQEKDKRQASPAPDPDKELRALHWRCHPSPGAPASFIALTWLPLRVPLPWR